MEKTVGMVKKILADMGPGSYFGEIAALIQEPRTASARVCEDAAVAVIDGDTFHSLLRESDNVAIIMLKEFSRRIKQSNEVLEDTTHAWLRLFMMLYFLKNDPLPRDGDPVGELSRLTGRDANEIEETIGELAQSGVLRKENGAITAFDRERAWQTAFKYLG